MTIEARVMERDDRRCFKCGAYARSTWPGYSCHHRRLRSAGGSDTPENRITLCGSGSTGCHQQVHGDRGLATDNGWIVSRYGPGPEDIPARHHALGMVYLTADGRVLTEEQWKEARGGDAERGTLPGGPAPADQG